MFADNAIKIWKQVTDDNGIQVYTREMAYSSIVKSKARTVINAPLNDIKMILDDVDHRHEWIPFLVLSKTLVEYKNNKKVEYSHFYAPWPASDRDFVYEIELISAENNKLIYTMKSVESVLMPVNNSKIRADLFETTYVLTKIDDNTTEVVLIYHADPKGWLPNWIINIIQKALPFKIMRNLKQRLKNQQNA